MRRLAVLLAAILLAGCGEGGSPSATSATASIPPAMPTDSHPTNSDLTSSAVTVPSLELTEATADPTSQPSEAVSAPTSSTGPSDSANESSSTGGAGADLTSTPTPAATSNPMPTVAEGGGVAVDLSTCAECSVLATAPQVRDGLSAALVGQAGRGVLLSVDLAGAVQGASNVPYGATFPAPPDRHLSCGNDSRCVVVAQDSSGRAVLSVFELGSDGQWADLSGSQGFVSATARGTALRVDGSTAVGIQVSDGSSTVWLVLAWNGSEFTTIGCAPDAESVAVEQVSPDTCLS
jgi:hypothetical protein